MMLEVLPPGEEGGEVLGLLPRGDSLFEKVGDARRTT